MINYVHGMLSWTWKSAYFNNNVHVERTMEVMYLDMNIMMTNGSE